MKAKCEKGESSSDRRFENGGQCGRTHLSPILGSDPPPPRGSKVIQTLVQKVRHENYWTSPVIHIFLQKLSLMQNHNDIMKWEVQ